MNLYILAVLCLLVLLNVFLSVTIFAKNRILKKQNSKLEEFANWQMIALTDDLTGIANRTAYHKKIETIEKKIKINSKNNPAILLFDIDNFKMINDTFGHLEGDKTIQFAAKLLSSLSLKYGYSVYRIGGDEFAVLSENTLEEQVINFLLDLKNEENKTDNFRFSKGYSIISKNENKAFPKAFSRADEMLYADKNSKKQ